MARVTMIGDVGGTHVRIGGRQFIGIDPKPGRAGNVTRAPLIPDGEVNLT